MRGLKSPLWSITPQGVVQQSPGLTDAGRSTLGVRQVAARTLKGFCRTSIPSVPFMEINFVLPELRFEGTLCTTPSGLAPFILHLPGVARQKSFNLRRSLHNAISAILCP